MEDKTVLAIVGIIALGIVAICFLAHISRSSVTAAQIEKAREIVRRSESE